ncbi:hypothetical protein FVE85_0911 [Porphyridium purpureum]|uniref:Profilin n=1 Tax=Porphyridium purpureum TaxID=35688 RepID=A0A5J4Z1Y9_PORPP|nr:hypothetical protein FVE85_0911 [Porphyridium purpureum]|eukprot:POR7434..scf208_2
MDVEALKNYTTDWQACVVFNTAGILFEKTENLSTGKPTELKFERDVRPILDARVFDDRDTAIGRGVRWLGNQYEISQWHASPGAEPQLLFGRCGGGGQDGVGLAIARRSADTDVYVLITYAWPIVAGLAVSQLRDLCLSDLLLADQASARTELAPASPKLE